MLINESGSFQVVVGFDFSDQAHLALDHALSLSRLYDSTAVHVLGVLDSRKGLGPYGAEGKVDFAAAEKAQEEIASIVKDRVSSFDSDKLHHFVHTRIGGPAKELIALSDETGADLIVVGTHGRKGVSRLVMGSIAEKVVRHGTCPVLVVRSPSHPVDEIDESLRPEPPCPQCVDKRVETNGQEWWCEVHSKHRNLPHPVASAMGPSSTVSSNWSRFNR